VVEVLLELGDPRTFYVFKLEDPQQLAEGLLVLRIELFHLLHERRRIHSRRVILSWRALRGVFA
jgi:hypothetical protein